MSLSEFAISVDLGGTKCAAALIAADGTLEYHQAVKYDHPEDASTVITQLIGDLMQKASLNRYHLMGIGISVPGISYVKKGTVWAPNIEGWEDFPLRQLIEDQLTVQALPVHIESDRGCSILGEKWMGSARGSDHAIFLAVGTGIGAGIMVDGRIIRGLHDIAGAIGWMALERPFHRKFAPYGCFEYYASGDGLVRAAREFIKNQSTDLINKTTITHMKAEDIFEAHIHKDAVAIKVFEQAIELWGMAAGNLVSLFNPEIIIFGGGVFGPGIRFLDQIYEEAARWAQPVAIRNVRFAGSTLKGNAPLMGAAYLVFKQRINENAL